VQPLVGRTAAHDERAAARWQRRYCDQLALASLEEPFTGRPTRATRGRQREADPLTLWRAGVSMVGMDFGSNELGMQLHRGVFALGDGRGYVLKPAGMRNPPADTSDGKPRPWPQPRQTLRHLSVRLVSLHFLPHSSERRPLLSEHEKFAPGLSSFAAPPRISDLDVGGGVSVPSLSVGLHSMGGYSCVTLSAAPLAEPNTHYYTGLLEGGLNARLETEVRSSSD